MSDDSMRLRAYLEQEEARISNTWELTTPEAKQEFIDWAASDNPSQLDAEDEWIDFAARVALWHIQCNALEKMKTNGEQ